MEVRLRIDGLLEVFARHEAATGRSMVARLMVMAHLLTYRLDIPQEGRLRVDVAGEENALELRVAIMPTTHGLRAAVRMPAELVQPRTLDELGLPPRVLEGLRQFAAIRQRHAAGDRPGRFGKDDDDLRAAGSHGAAVPGRESRVAGGSRRARSSRRDADRSLAVRAAHVRARAARAFCDRTRRC